MCLLINRDVPLRDRIGIAEFVLCRLWEMNQEETELIKHRERLGESFGGITACPTLFEVFVYS